MKTIQHWIDGRIAEGASGRYGVVTNPATGEQTGQVALANTAEVDRAVASAAEAFPSWSNSSLAQRTQVLFNYRELLNAHRDELAEGKGENRQDEACARQRRNNANARHAGGAHHRVLGCRDELRQREERSDQDGNGKELVDMPRDGEQDVHDDQSQRIAAATEVFNLLDHVEEREQHDQRGDDERCCQEDLDGYVAAQRFHRIRRNTENTIRRR